MRTTSAVRRRFRTHPPPHGLPRSIDSAGLAARGWNSCSQALPGPGQPSPLRCHPLPFRIFRVSGSIGSFPTTCTCTAFLLAENRKTQSFFAPLPLMAFAGFSAPLCSKKLNKNGLCLISPVLFSSLRSVHHPSCQEDCSAEDNCRFFSAWNIFSQISVWPRAEVSGWGWGGYIDPWSLLTVPLTLLCFFPGVLSCHIILMYLFPLLIVPPTRK